MPLKKPAAAAAAQAGPPSDIKALRDASAELRWSAARALAGNPGAVAALDEALAAESDQRVRAAMFTSLSQINNAASFAAVLRYLRADDAQQHGEALEAMQRMPELAQQNLEALLHDPDTDVRILACDLARGLAAPRATRLLAHLLMTETNLNVCATAIEVLAETGEAADLAGLEACAARFPDEPFLGFAIKTAARLIRSRAGGPDA